MAEIARYHNTADVAELTNQRWQMLANEKAERNTSSIWLVSSQWLALGRVLHEVQVKDWLFVWKWTRVCHIQKVFDKLIVKAFINLTFLEYKIGMQKNSTNNINIFLLLCLA